MSVRIGAVESETGLSMDILRVWERRYGFPAPSRDANGERVYPAEQVEKLRLIRRLMDRGGRPGKLVSASLHELNSRIEQSGNRHGPEACNSDGLRDLVRLLKAGRVTEVRELLSLTLMQLGLRRFVSEVVGPLNILVGDEWARGQLAISEEHLYTEQIQHVLRQAISSLTPARQWPAVLLTTLPGEEHQLGLLMAQACLTVEGAPCVSLGIQTPASEIVRAARVHRVDIVGLSFSEAFKVRAARTLLADLREQLDPNIEIWAGGAIWQLSGKTVPGVTLFSSLADIPATLAERRARHMG